ncbi:methyl-accepting chemotaxis protein [Azonexus sp. IMCC34842]|uniref:methyl-accepting chemotaxis protein n=1 Tax=Azonexus sp. IMCC34842 TaxID=3420950 RepID=UPI003D0BAD67
MTIAKRLAILILVAVAGLVVVGSFGLRQMGAINSNLQYAHENSIPSIRKVANMESSFLRLRVAVLGYLLSSEEQRPTYEKRIENSKQDLELHLRDYEKLISDDKDKQYLETSKGLVKDYLPLLDNAIVATKAGQPDKAKSGMGQAGELSKKIGENIEAHAKYNETLAEGEVQKAADAYSSGKVVSIMVILLATAVTGLMGFMLYRHVTTSLGGMVAIFLRIESSLDFTGRLPIKGDDEVAKAGGAFNRLLDRLQGSLQEIARHTTGVNSAANRVATSSNQMSIASSHQSEAASSMAATVEEMTVSINHVADRAREANGLSVSSGEQAQRGESIIGQTVVGINGIAETVRSAAEQISRLEQQSERINHVVSVIKEVADQTNLLALNAAIEAARAGEQGRGFAVVADEVRKLAERTTQSTQEIGKTIAEMQTSAQSAVQGIGMVVEKVEAGVSSAEEANVAIQAIGSSSRQAVNMVGDISDAIREQSVASTSIAQQVEQIAQMSEENSSASSSTSETAGELARLAAEMHRVVAQYRV